MKHMLDFYKGKRVFITGHTGFKGSWLCKILRMARAEVTGFALPPTDPSLFEIGGIGCGMHSVYGDIRDLQALQSAFETARPEIVFHLAAQPIVRESYKNPVYTYETNVMGTVHLLECVRASQAPVKSVVVITTDKVYENNNWAWGYRENDRLNGFDPYSNSKSCAELVTDSYRNSFFADGPAISTARAGNVIGGGDFASNRIIPDCVRAMQAQKPIEIRNPYSVRPYQHVLEPLSAYLLIAQKQYEDKKFAGSYNVGPDSAGCLNTGELANLFCKAWGEGARWIHTGKDGPHEDNILKLDCSKIQAVLGWRPRWDVGRAVAETVAWTKAWLGGQDVNACMERQIIDFFKAGMDEGTSRW